MKNDKKDHSAELIGQPIPDVAETKPRPIRERICAAGTGWCAFSHQHDNSRAAIAASIETLTILNERITAKFTPGLDSGTAWDALLIVAETLCEMRVELVGKRDQLSMEPALPVKSEA